MVKRVAKKELGSEKWLQLVAKLSGRSYEQMRVIILEFLDTDAFSVSAENCVTFLDPVIESWDIDLMTFAMEIVLNRRLAHGYAKRFEFVEKDAEQTFEEQGLKEFLRDRSLSGDANKEEIEFLRRLRFNGKSPTALYYYRALQGLRDPLHFRSPAIQPSRTKKMGRSQPEGSIAPMQKHLDVRGIEKQLQLDGRKRATKRWAANKRSSHRPT